MIDTGIIITGVVGIVSSVITGWVSWFYTRKKYNSEVDSTLIKNMQDSLDFYKKLSDDNRERLDEMIKRNDALEEEIKDLRKVVSELMLLTCKDLTCKVRQVNFKLNG